MALVSAVFLALGASVSCGDPAGEASRVQTPPPPPSDPCEVTDCGTQCTADEQCPLDQHCGSNGECTATCAIGDNTCAPGECGERGRCINSQLDPNEPPPATGGSGGMGGPGCVDVAITIDKLEPTVVLLIDQSASMNARFDGGPTTLDTERRWHLLRDALLDVNAGILKTLENDIRFGLALYHSDDGLEGGAVCPILTEVPVSLQNHSAIQGVYGAATVPNGGDTPTGESVDAVAAQLVGLNDNSPKVIVLATDGEPDTCEDPDAQEAGPARQEQARQVSIAAVENAFASGVLTFVISVGQDVALTHLQDLANAGQGEPVGGANNVPYYVTTNQGELSAAFLDIINNPGVRSCVFDLNVSVPTGSVSRGNVSLNGTELAHNDPNGWRLNSPTQIELMGTSCESIKQGGEHDIDIFFPCVIPIE